MGWLDDAKKKAQQAASDATTKAQEEAGKAALNAMWGAMKRSVGAVAEKILGSAEAELEAQQAARKERDSEEAPKEPEAEADPEALAKAERERKERERKEREEAIAEKQRAAAAKEQAARDELARMKADVGGSGKQARAAPREVLREESDIEEPPMTVLPETPDDPMAAAQAVLDRASAARQMAKKGSRAAAREEKALEELRRLKSMRVDTGDEENDGSDNPSRKRDL